MTIWKKLRQWSRLFYLIAFLALVGLFSTAMWSKKATSAEEIIIDIEPTVEGGYLLTANEVKKMLTDKIRKTGAQNLSRVPVSAMEDLIQKHPLVERADVYIDARNRIKVRIEQPEPVIRIIDRRGANYYISDKRKKIPLSRHFTPRVPVATGDIPMWEDSLALKPGNAISALYQLAELMQTDDFMGALVEQIDIKDGVISLVPKMGKFQIVLGDCRQLTSKVSRLKTFYKGILPTKGWDAYKLVDLRYKDQVVCRKV